MHVRFAILLAVGLLATPAILADSSSDAPSTTPEGTTAATPQPSGTSSVTDSSSPVPAASSASPDPSATTLNPGTQPSGATTPGAASNSSTAAPTVGGSTVSAGPTTSAPLPNVTVSIVQFDSATCDDEVCTYSISAPRNDQVLLATEDSIIATDRTQFSGLQSQAATKDKDIKKANDDAQAKINELQTLLNSIQSNLNSIQGSIVTIQSQQTDAKNTLQFVQKFINDVNNSPGTCLYQRCLKPTTPAPPTTTPTPAPTTPPSPCVNFTCPGDPDGSQHCQLDEYNKPSCDNCDGNFNATDHCVTVACSSLGTGFRLNSTGRGDLFSTGYDLSNPDSSAVPAGANCQWNLNGTFQIADNSSVAYNASCLASNNVVMFIVGTDGFSQQLSSGLSVRSFNRLLDKVPNPTFTLTSSNGDPSYCSFPLQRTDLPTPASFAVEKKQNGFFSWLMGY